MRAPLSRCALAAAFACLTLACADREGRAATARLCNQQVDYSLAAPVAGVAPELRAFSGVWVGSVNFSRDAEMCVAMVVEAVGPDGVADTRFAWFTGSDSGILNVASLGAVSWSGKVERGALRLTGTQNGNTYTYEFHPVGGDELRGYFAQNTDRTPLVMRRR